MMFWEDVEVYIRHVFCILNSSYIQAAFLACDFFLHDFALTQLENLRHWPPWIDYVGDAIMQLM
jgi:hypothetical protein